MDESTILKSLENWLQSFHDLSPATKAISASLAAAWLYESEDADLSQEPWTEVPLWIQSAIAEANEESLSQLEAIEQTFQYKPLSVIAADADQIQAYVFESAKIPEVLGASALVEWLNMDGLIEVMNSFKLTKDSIVYQGGGGALLLVPAAQVKNVQRAIEEQFVRKTLIATITTVSRSVCLQDLMESNRFQELRTSLMHSLQVAKLQKEVTVHFEWLPFARRCQACEVRPAHSLYRASADQPVLCEVCQNKREKGRSQRLPKDFINYLVGIESPAYLHCTGKNLKPKDLHRAEDLKEISDKGYVGVIAADGDGVGSILPKLNSLSEYAHFSQKLYDLSKKCVYDPLARYLCPQSREPNPGQREYFHPFELITLGGDDLFLIVPAQKAITIAQGISHYWQEHKKDVIPLNRQNGEDQIPSPTLSLGLLICPCTFPLYFMHQLAEQLLQHAKSARSNAKANEGYVDFLILKSSGTPRTKADQIQKTLYCYQEDSSGESLQLTERPYSLSSFNALIGIASDLRQAGMTRTQRYALAQSLRLGRLRSTVDTMFYWARRPEEQEQIRTAFAKWATQMGGQGFPWKQHDRRHNIWKTQLLDVLELTEWVEVDGNAKIGDDSALGSGNTP